MASEIVGSNYLFWLQNAIFDYESLFSDIVMRDLKEIFASDYDEDLKELYEILSAKSDKSRGNISSSYLSISDEKGTTTRLIKHLLIPLLSFNTVSDENNHVHGLTTFGSDYTNSFIPVSGGKGYLYTVLALVFARYLENSSTIVKQINNISYIQKLLSAGTCDTNNACITPSPLHRALGLKYNYGLRKEHSSFDSTRDCDLYEYNLFYFADFLVKEILSVDNILKVKSQITWIKNKYFDSNSLISDKPSDLCSICGETPTNALATGDCHYCHFNKYRSI